MGNNKVLSIDASKCRGCLSCMVACATKNYGVGNLALSRIKVTAFPKASFFSPTACFQCETAYCSLACPTNALKKNAETKLVDFDKTKCIGCKVCAMTCPFGNITFVNGEITKCDTCGGDPICARVCADHAIEFCDADAIGASKRASTSKIVMESLKGMSTDVSIK